MLPRFVSFFLLAAAVCAQPYEFWPGAQYDPAIPSIEKVLGFAPGTRHPTHAEIVRYFEALAAAAPTRMKVQEYGRTFEGRRLIYAVLTGPENFARLAGIQKENRRLGDPRATPPAEARKIAASNPVIIALIAAIHGNEPSGPDALLLAAYHLLAARNDALVNATLKNVVVLIDPLQNPDGRDRFVNSYRQNEGLEPDPSPAAAERIEPWPGGRSNHYLFDLNRDWFALTQPESRGRVKYLTEWSPQVVADLHEMGAESTYFFAPWPPPHNPGYTAAQLAQSERFGKNNARWFDKFGWPYFTREVFDLFYPGYGGSWPAYLGGLSMTYENASVRGLVVRKSDGTLYNFRESIQKQFVASLATCETAANERTRLLQEFYDNLASAISETAKEKLQAYILPRRGDVSAVDKLARVLAAQGIEVSQAGGAVSSGGQQYPAGSYVIPLAQPRKRLIRTLLDPLVPMAPEFLREQERRRSKRLASEIYDITAWSLPLLYNIECVPAAAAVGGSLAPLASLDPPKGGVTGEAEVAYLIPWGTQASGRFLAAALREGLYVLSAGKALTHAGRRYPSGTLIVPVQRNGGEVHAKVAGIAGRTSAEAVAANSSWVDDGVDFGSNNTRPLRRPVVALLWDTPVSTLSAGHTRFVMERQYGFPVTALRAASLPVADLSQFQVLILPEGNYSTLPAAAAERIRNWVRDGGVLIGIGGALTYLSSQPVSLLDLRQEAAAGAAPKPAESAKPPAPQPGSILASEDDLRKAVMTPAELPDPISGVLLRARVDPEHWVTAGMPETVNVMVSGRTIYAPLKRDQGVNAATFEEPGKLLASGYLWEENRKQLAFKPFIVVANEGRGTVVGFTADPNYRAYLDGLNTAFLNAVFRFPRAPVRGGAGFGEEGQ